ncbi:MAG TPA: zf-HC2 domain-containing protein [Gemmatimonadaceae bacterium]|nr:zf-HC2 domain-containing protein [Gemmatimonadaceae bacterium]
MQHLSEGTIHSWLDGALTADEAARVEAHVKECPECAAIVAEARGFIAGASRILTALDNAPRGVIPVVARKKRIDPMVWRVAATLVVIATGTLVVFRNDGRKTELATRVADSASEIRVTDSIRPIAPASPSIDQTMKAAGEAAPSVTNEQSFSVPAPVAMSTPRAGSTAKIAEKGITADAEVTAQRSAAPAAPTAQGSTEPAAAIAQRSIVTAAPAARTAYSGSALSAPLQANAQALDSKEPNKRSDVVAEEQLSLRVVGTPRTLGAKVTLYEVAPGDTVTLREESSTRLESVVTVTGAAAAPLGRQSVEKSAPPAQAQRAADTPVVGAADSQRSVGAVGVLARAPSAPAPVTRVEFANGVTTIVWVDAASGNVMRLSGLIREERLQQIKARIERERAAAAAAARKSP